MAELRVLVNPESRAGSVNGMEQAGGLSGQARGQAPIWRSLLSPSAGQRALVLGDPGVEVLRLLKSCNVQVERSLSTPRVVGNGGFDFIVEELRGWRSQLEPFEAASLLGDDGRWIFTLEGSRLLGLRSRRILSRMRRRGFDMVERYYAHPTLWTPEVLVPLERREPFDFFLRLTVGGGAVRRYAILGFSRVLCRLGLHRDVLPNCIVVARRSR